jgi:hypothetical protein
MKLSFPIVMTLYAVYAGARQHFQGRFPESTADWIAFGIKVIVVSTTTWFVLRLLPTKWGGIS